MLIIIIITRSHGSHQCCKGETTSQWEKVKLPLSPHPHPLTDSHEILHTSNISPHTPHLVKIAPGVTSPHIANVNIYFFSFFVRKIFQPT